MNKEILNSASFVEQAKYRRLHLETWTGAAFSSAGFILMIYGVATGDEILGGSGAAITGVGALYGDYFERRRFAMQQEIEDSISSEDFHEY